MTPRHTAPPQRPPRPVAAPFQAAALRPAAPAAAPRTARTGSPDGPPAAHGPAHTGAYVTLAGAEWLASSTEDPQALRSAWLARPTAAALLPCGRAFDVVSAPAVFGQAMVDQLWSDGPGSGPVAVHRGRLLVFASSGTAGRLPELLRWMTAPATGSARTAACPPPLLCHGRGDTVTLPGLYPATADAEGPSAAARSSRWLVAPEVRGPWLPGAEALLWAALRAGRQGAAGVREPWPGGDHAAPPRWASTVA